MAGINDYSNTAGSNTTINGIDIAEGCSPAGINNAIRQLMADIADVDDGVVPLQTPDINGGTIDGAIIGGTTPAAGTFTNLTATGTLTGLLGNVVEDATPQLGGNLDLNSNDITGTGNINMTGNVTATSFFGDGSNLTGIGDASGLTDADGDTKIQSEESADEDKLRFDTAGSERAVMDSNGLFFTTNGGFVAHHNDIANDMSLTNQNMMLVGSVTVSGTLTVGTGSTVVII